MLSRFGKSRVGWLLVAIGLVVAMYLFVQMDRQSALNEMNIETKSKTIPSTK